MKQKDMFSWLYSQLGDKKPSFALSVFFALLEVCSGIVPFIMVAAIVQLLINGEKALSAYGLYIGLMALFFTLRVIFHAISTTFSHVATFNVC